MKPKKYKYKKKTPNCGLERGGGLGFCFFGFGFGFWFLVFGFGFWFWFLVFGFGFWFLANHIAVSSTKSKADIGITRQNNYGTPLRAACLLAVVAVIEGKQAGKAASLNIEEKRGLRENRKKAFFGNLQKSGLAG